MAERSARPPSLEAIIRDCQAEALQSSAHERGSCFELFRRALEERDQLAWMAIEGQYRRLVLGWVRARLPELAPADVEGLAHEAFEKLWRTLAARPAGIAGQFGHVGALLRYLQQCAITATLDHQRRTQRAERLLVRLQRMHTLLPAPIAPDQAALEALTRLELRTRVRAWLAANVTDAQERRVLALSYEDDLTPAEIVARYPAEFPDAQAVRRIKERVLKRARRAFGDLLADAGNG